MSKRKRRMFEAVEPRHMLSAQGFVPDHVFDSSADMEVTIASIDQDERPDIVQAFGTQGDIRVLGTDTVGDDGDGHFFSPARSLLMVPGGFSAIAVTDLNGDQKTDFIVARSGTTQLHWYEAMGDVYPYSYQEHVIADFPTFQPTRLIVGDAQVDGRRQLFAIGAEGVNLFEASNDLNFALADAMAVEITDVDILDAADVDGDGPAELFIQDNNRLTMVPTDGGRFGAGTVVAEDAYRFGLFDLNGDERSELILAASERPLAIMTFVDGRFDVTVEASEGYGPASIDVADVDADGQQEVAMRAGGELIVLNGETLELKSRFPLLIQTASRWSRDRVNIEFVNINGDALPDLFVYDRNWLSWYANEGGGFARHHPFKENAFVFASEDFDGDGRQDPVFRDDDRVAVWLSSEGFESRTIYTLGNVSPSAHKVADVNGDNAPDFVMSVRNQLFVSLFDPVEKTFAPAKEIVRLNSSIGDFHVSDLNGDDLPDLFVTPWQVAFRYRIDVFHQSVDGSFGRTQQLLNEADAIQESFTGDFDGNGHVDLVTFENSQITTLLNGGSQLVPKGTVDGPEILLASLDFDGDGQDELLSRDSNGRYTLARFSLETGEYVLTDVGAGATQIFEIGDFNSDGRDDIRGGSSRTVREFLATDDGFQESSSLRLNASVDFASFSDPSGDGVVKPIFTEPFKGRAYAVSYADAVAVASGNFATQNLIWQRKWFDPKDVWGDFDGDGKDDWAAIDPSGIYVSFGGEQHGLAYDTDAFDAIGQVEAALSLNVDRENGDELVLLGDEATAVIDVRPGDRAIVLRPLGDLSRAFRTYDVDGDGYEEGLSWNWETAAIEWREFSNEGNVNQLLKVDFPVSDVHFADLDLDGDEDAVVTGDGVAIYSRTADGEFELQQHVVADVEINRVASGDLDNDGDVDLVVGSTIFTAVLRRDESGFYSFTEQVVPLSAFNYEPQGGLFVEDIDSDGRLDIVANDTWYRNEQADRFGPKFEPQPTQGLLFDEMIDVNGDGVAEAFDRRNRTLSSLQDVDDAASEAKSELIAHPNNITFKIQQAYWADVNGDTVQEIVAHDGEAIWLFEPVLDGWLPTKVLEGYVSSILVVDFDQNGSDEIYHEGRSFGRVRQENGFWVGTHLQGDTSYKGLAAVDINLDGDKDLLTFHSSLYYYETVDGLPFRHRPNLRSDNVRGREIFERSDTYLGTADFNRDGVLDGVSRGREGIELHLSLVEPKGPRYRPAVILESARGDEIAVAITDVDGDGWTDLTLARDGQLQWIQNSPDGFAATPQELAAIEVGDVVELNVHDVDDDGADDFIIENAVGSTILMTRGETFSSVEISGNGLEFDDDESDPKILNIGSHGELLISVFDDVGGFETTTVSHRLPILASGDFDNDGKDEFVIQSGGDGGTLVVGDGFSQSHDQIAGNRISSTVATLDMNSDGWLDIVQLSSRLGPRAFSWSENLRGQGFRQHIVRHDRGPQLLTDVDGDSYIDVIVLSGDGDIWLRNLGDSFAEPEALFDGGRTQAAFDANNDGNTDLVVSFADESTKLFFGRAERAIPTESVNLQVDWTTVFVADVDGNGYTDIVGRDGGLLKNGPTGFEPPTIAISGATVGRAKDFDGDGDVDLLTSDFDGWFENAGDGTFGERLATSPTQRRIEEALAIDINGDGLLEIIGLDDREGAQLLPQSYDFDDDGSYAIQDVDLIHAAILGSERELRFDINNDGRISSIDGMMYVEAILKTFVGDSDLDGTFGSADLVSVFQKSKYEQDIDATWDDGDWNFDGRFDSSDIVLAFRRSQYAG